ncbi:hypothetical protein BCR33DRAFT_717342, partial [Rhizoclosmatium globosum]
MFLLKIITLAIVVTRTVADVTIYSDGVFYEGQTVPPISYVERMDTNYLFTVTANVGQTVYIQTTCLSEFGYPFQLLPTTYDCTFNIPVDNLNGGSVFNFTATIPRTGSYKGWTAKWTSTIPDDDSGIYPDDLFKQVYAYEIEDETTVSTLAPSSINSFTSATSSILTSTASSLATTSTLAISTTVSTTSFTTAASTLSSTNVPDSTTNPVATSTTYLATSTVPISSTSLISTLLSSVTSTEASSSFTLTSTEVVSSSVTTLATTAPISSTDLISESFTTLA